MGRKSFYEKLSERGDFSEILKRVSLVPNPTNYVISSFGCSPLTAKKFVTQVLHTASVAVKNDKNTTEEELHKVQTDILEEELENQVEQNANTETIIKIKEKLNNLSLPVLSCLFQRLSKIDTTLVSDRGILANGITYLIQKKYYKQIFGFEFSDRMEKKTGEMVRRCIHVVN